MLITPQSSKQEVENALKQFIPSQFVTVLERRNTSGNGIKFCALDAPKTIKIIVRHEPEAIQAVVQNQKELTELGFNLDFYGGTTQQDDIEEVMISIKPFENN